VLAPLFHTPFAKFPIVVMSSNRSPNFFPLQPSGIFFPHRLVYLTKTSCTECNIHRLLFPLLNTPRTSLFFFFPRVNHLYQGEEGWSLTYRPFFLVSICIFEPFLFVFTQCPFPFVTLHKNLPRLSSSAFLFCWQNLHRNCSAQTFFYPFDHCEKHVGLLPLTAKPLSTVYASRPSCLLRTPRPICSPPCLSFQNKRFFPGVEHKRSPPLLRGTTFTLPSRCFFFVTPLVSPLRPRSVIEGDDGQFY